MTAPAMSFSLSQKAELHAHLNGCIPTEVVKELLKEFSVRIPEGFDPETDLQVTTTVATLAEYFRPWYLLKLLPVGKTCLDRMVLEALRSLSGDSVRYVELRNSPFSIAKQNDISLEEGLEWLVDSLNVASSQTGIDARLIPGLSRFDCSPEQGLGLLAAIKATNRAGRIVGVDLSGDEDKPIDGELARFFRMAKDEIGLGVTIHAGETFVASNVEWAVKECGADRIGHGLAAAAEPHLLEFLANRDVCVEVCLSSNILTGRVATVQQHPIGRFIESGVPFVLCTDNPSVHNVPLSGEYALFSDRFPESAILDTMYDRQLRYSFRNGDNDKTF
jgi:adenosine deaminase